MIALYRGISATSRVIEWFTHGAYSHAAWVCADGTVVSALAGQGVIRTPDLDAAHTDGTPIEIYSVPGVDYARADAWAATQLGKPYDYRGLFGYLTRKDYQNPAAWFCSEYVFQIVRAGGVELLARVESWQVVPTLLACSPLMVADMCRKTFDPSRYRLQFA